MISLDAYPFHGSSGSLTSNINKTVTAIIIIDIATEQWDKYKYANFWLAFL